MDRFVEYYEWRVRRGFIDPDVAEMILADYATRHAAIRQSRDPRDLLSALPRPRPAKHAGGVRRMAKAG